MTTLEITVSAIFVPWSKSRDYAAEKKVSERTLNWKVTVSHRGRAVVTTDYSAGLAHCPGYKSLVSPRFGHLSIHDAEIIKFETERGRQHTASDLGGKPILPDSVDVLWSLLQDAGAIDSGSFEDWAAELGDDTDSRKAEVIYRSCLDIGLKLRAALGDEGLRALREASQDY